MSIPKILEFGWSIPKLLETVNYILLVGLWDQKMIPKILEIPVNYILLIVGYGTKRLTHFKKK